MGSARVLGLGRQPLRGAPAAERAGHRGLAALASGRRRHRLELGKAAGRT